MVAIFQSDWQSLPIWKIVVLVAVCLGIVWWIFRTGYKLKN